MTVSVLGAGWLGGPIAQRLVADGHAVRASTTTPDRLDEIAGWGATPGLLDLNDRADLASWCRADGVVVTIAPGGVQGYPTALHRLGTFLRSEGAQRVVFTSSTSVYADTPSTVTELDAGPSSGHPLSERGRVVWEAEEALRSMVGDRLVVLRLAGLVGPDRHPGRFLAGRTGQSRPEAPVNLVDREDAVRAVAMALTHPKLEGAFNICAPRHPTRRAFYTAESERLGLDPPGFVDDGTSGKAVSAEAFRKATGWTADWLPGVPVEGSAASAEERHELGRERD